MTQEQLDTLTELWCLTAQESLRDFEVVVENKNKIGSYPISINHPNIKSGSCSWEFIKDHYTPKEKAKIIISLLEQIVENCDKWLQDELDYHGDKLAEKGDNDYKSNKENG